MASLSSEMNFTPSALKSKSMSSRKIRLSLNPNNGSTFDSLSQIKFQLPSLPRTYCRLPSVIIKGRIQITGAQHDVAIIERNIYSIINRLEVSVANVQLSNINNFNTLAHAMNDIGTDAFNVNFSHDCLLAGGDPANKTLGQSVGRSADGNAVEFAFPMPSLGVFQIPMLPCDVQENITMTLHLEDYRNAFLKAHGDITGYTVDNLELQCDLVELSVESQAALQSSLGGSPYVMDFEDTTATNFTKAAADTVHNQNIGARYSSLTRCLMVQRRSANLQSLEQASLSARSHAKLSEFQLKIGSTLCPQISIKNTAFNQTDVLAHLQQFEGLGYGNNALQSSLNTPALMDYATLDKVAKVADGANAAALTTALQAVQVALHSGLVGSTAATGTTNKVGTLGDAQNVSTFIRPSTNAGQTNAHFSRFSQFGVENAQLFLADGTTTNNVGAAALTRAKVQREVGTFAVGLDLSVFDSENLYNNVSSIGQNTEVVLKYYGASTSAQAITFYTFYNAIIQLNPITNMFELAGL